MTKDTIKIGGVTYPISVVEGLRDGDVKLDGFINYRPYSIQLNAEMGNQGERIVLWHEILHGILAQAGFGHEDEYEKVFDTLAYGITQVLQDNPWLREDA